ncbi:hypothetical protein K458DRAFT_46064 [Lentithecium fluviatile CBS 122367]|uniref:Uncharacterized protein n=1 Tax=Lentithecium fluviatile CBS 122367 TaxID=1168545 RepID=A0A6G1IYS7_9PLEO|nr:hypothetical protein K458DRAFT_46064 [Lentithecium fluviatile CBS 122367]
MGRNDRYECATGRIPDSLRYFSSDTEGPSTSYRNRHISVFMFSHTQELDALRIRYRRLSPQSLTLFGVFYATAGQAANCSAFLFVGSTYRSGTTCEFSTVMGLCRILFTLGSQAEVGFVTEIVMLFTARIMAFVIHGPQKGWRRAKTGQSLPRRVTGEALRVQQWFRLRHRLDSCSSSIRQHQNITRFLQASVVWIASSVSCNVYARSRLRYITIQYIDPPWYDNLRSKVSAVVRFDDGVPVPW